MDLKLENKLALVTGSTGGIGFAIVESLAAEGARVVVNGRSKERVSQALEKIRQAHPQARLEALAADLAKPEGAAETIRRFPAVDILVNNLGMYEARPFEAISDAHWQAIIETNFMSGVRLSRHYLPGMKAANWGRIIFLSSESGVNIPVEMIHYGVTKAMYLALSRGLAETTVGTAVTVNAVLPAPPGPRESKTSSPDWHRRRALLRWKWKRNSSGPSGPPPSCSASPAPQRSPTW